jgi:hypothetical protein
MMTGVSCLLVMSSHARQQGSGSRRAASEAGGLVVAGRLRFRDRITARWRSRRLDVALAAGASAEAAAALSSRARRLTELSRRRAIAEALLRVVREAHVGAPPSLVRITPSRRGVLAAGDELTKLAAGLAEPGPVAARGVAQAWILLTDGSGPLYDPSSSASLEAVAVRAAENLRPRSA